MVHLVAILFCVHLLHSVNSFVSSNYYANLTLLEDALNMQMPPNFNPTGLTRNKRTSTPIRTFEETHEPTETYDFIIVGSGPAGSILANRLTENEFVRVLLLEEGEIPTNMTDIPATANSFLFTDYNCGYQTEPERNAALGVTNRIMNFPRACVVGGASTIGACTHIRGNRLNFDRWADAGNTGWSFADVLPYFKKSEDFLVSFQDPGYHRRGGLLGVQDVPYRSESSYAFVNSMLEAGYRYVDYDGAQQIGVSFAHGTLRRGRRSAAYNSFLEPFLSSRGNLRLITGAKVVKILIDESKAAYGVRYAKDDTMHTVRARKEVIISSGVFGSPQLLMLSGIGPKEHLQEIGIDVIQDLQVGKNLGDHICLYGTTLTLNESIAIPYNEIGTSDKPMEDFLSGTGILTTLTGTEAFGIIKTPYTGDPDPNYPDVQLIFIGTSNNVDNGVGFKALIGVTDEVYDAIWGPIQNVPAVTIMPMLLQPKSRGHMELRSGNPYDAPVFHGNFFTDPDDDDVKVLASSVRVIQELVKMPAFQRYDAKFVEPLIPGCGDYQYDTDEFWECFVRYLGLSAWHQVGTCKMGPSTDAQAVVDPRLRVHGISRLRVVDASIMPGPIAAHTHIPTVMIGEKAADMIKRTWKI